MIVHKEVIKFNASTMKGDCLLADFDVMGEVQYFRIENGRCSLYFPNMDGSFDHIADFHIELVPESAFVISMKGYRLTNSFSHRVDGRPTSLIRSQMYLEQFIDGIAASTVIAVDDEINPGFASFIEQFRKPMKKAEVDITAIFQASLNDFKNRVNNGDNPDVSSFITISERGRVHSKFGTICHAELFSGDAPRSIIYDEVRAYYNRSSYKMEYAEYVDYLVNESVFKDCFLVDTLDNILNQGVCYNTQAPGYMVYASAIMLRQPSEFEADMPRIAFFAKEVTNGDWIAAWLLGQLFHTKDNNKFTRGYFCNRHKLFGEYANWQAVCSFLQKGYIGKSKKASDWSGDGKFYTSSELVSEYEEGLHNICDAVNNVIKKKGVAVKKDWGAPVKEYSIDDVKCVYKAYKEFGNA